MQIDALFSKEENTSLKCIGQYVWILNQIKWDPLQLIAIDT
jgi:hypothetical protein